MSSDKEDRFAKLRKIKATKLEIQKIKEHDYEYVKLSVQKRRNLTSDEALNVADRLWNRYS